MSLITQVAIAQDASFQSRVQLAMLQAAVNIYSESAGTTGHVARAAYAVNVLNNPASYLDRFVKDVASQESTVGTTLASATDAAITNAIAGIWNALAGA